MQINKFKIALAGNPNSGKSTLFNALTGLHQKVGNYPGITVDKRTGKSKMSDGTYFEIIDLPGTYSLYPKSLDESVTQQVLCNTQNKDYPDVTVVIADASNLRKSIFLLSQIIDLNMKVILAINMIDIARDIGVIIDSESLSSILGIPVVEINARNKTGINDLKRAIQKSKSPKETILDVANLFPEVINQGNQIRKSDNNYATFLSLCRQKIYNNSAVRIKLEVLIKEEAFIPSRCMAKETIRRYKKIDKILEKCIGYNKQLIKRTFTKKLDDLLLHPILGYLIFLFLLFLVFQAVFSWSSYPMDLIDAGFGDFTNLVATYLPKGIFNDLLVNGVLAGLGGILIFIPQIAFLFAFIVFLEDTGYMARVSFITDKWLRGFGLNGRSIIPLLSGTACAVPAVMSCRTISSFKERLITIMVVPLMSCAARLPVYTLIISMIIPESSRLGFFNTQGVVMMGFYLLGFIAALLTALILKFLVKRTTNDYSIIEMPSYKVPDWKTVLYTIIEKVKIFLFDAGKVIIAISIVLWVLSSHGPSKEIDKIESKYANNEMKMKEKKLEASYAGIIGKSIEPVIKPLGFDWRIGISLITSFAAREVFVGTMSTIYSVGGTDHYSIKEKLRNAKNTETGTHFFTTAVGVSLMLFYAFAMQCMSTIAVVYRETKGWKWPLIQLFYMSGLAYLSSFIAYSLFK